jgi:hypothetical protein
VPIALEATLTYVGPESEAVIVASGSGPIAFSLAQVGGTIRIDPVRAGSCQGLDMQRNKPHLVPFQKSGAYDPKATGADATFYREYFARPELLLPAGEWAAAATFDVALGDCSGERFTAQVPINLTVAP